MLEKEDRKNVSAFPHLKVDPTEKRRQEAGPSRVGKKKKKKGIEQSSRLPPSKQKPLPT